MSLAAFEAPPAPETLGLADAAAMMRLGVDAARELVVAGEIPAVSLNAKHMVILREDVLAWLRKMARQQQVERQSRVTKAAPIATLAADDEQPRRRGARRKALPRLEA